MTILDSNVISELMRPEPDLKVVQWLDVQSKESIWTSSINIFEMRYGLWVLPDGKRRQLLIKLFEYWMANLIGDRIATYDFAAAENAAKLAAERKRAGRPGELRDTMLAGIVIAAHANLATRNVRHFDEIADVVVNPWEV